MLTDEQRKLVEENHNLIWAYIKMRGLNPDEYYDILAIALCLAATTYDPTASAFSTWLFWKFRGVVGTSNRSAHSPKRNGLLISFDEPLTDDDSFKLEDTLSDGDDFAAGADLRTMISTLNCTDKEIVRLRECGLTQEEIGKRLHISQIDISRRLSAIKRYISTGIYKKARRNTKMEHYIKPPLGAAPHWATYPDRIEELSGAISRYAEFTRQCATADANIHNFRLIATWAHEIEALATLEADALELGKKYGRR